MVRNIPWQHRWNGRDNKEEVGFPIPPRTGRRSKLVQPFLSLEQGDTGHGGYLLDSDTEQGDKGFPSAV